MTNNALKRKHLPKKTRHWKCMIDVNLSDDELKYAMTDVKELSNLVNKIMNRVIDRYTQYINEHRPEWWKL